MAVRPSKMPILQWAPWVRQRGAVPRATAARHVLCSAGVPLVVLSTGLISPANAADWKADPWRVEPSITGQETWTDNVNLQPSTNARSDLITEISPGLSIHGAGGRVRADLDYRLTGLLYARDSALNDTQNFLNASGVVEAVEKILFVEARAQIAQQTISAFGIQPASNASATANRTETRNFSVSPYSKGSLGQWAAYDVRFQTAATRTKEETGTDSNVRRWDGRVASTTSLASFGWVLDYQNVRNDFRNGLDTKSTWARGTITYNIDPNLRVFARGGKETNNYFVEDRSYTTHGLGLEWAPTERTQLSLENDKRFFGRGYRYAFRHRTPHTAWNFVATQDATTTTNQLTKNPTGTAFDRFFDLLASQVPDPVQRAEQVRQLLISTGIPPESIPQAGFLATSVFIEKRAEASVALLGVRNTMTLSLFRSESKPVSLNASAADDFVVASRIVQRGAGVDWNHKLSSLSSLATMLRWERNSGSGTSTAEQTTLRSVSVALDTQLSPKTTGSIGLRHVRFDSEGGSGSDYRENAVLASVVHRF